ncbi:isopenicillin N synthase family oxygenase [Phenylobacterium sp.]|uniref:isopenicillin N synthase family dioxygenase n=1 Tax=Phenylobacterium sp. TaxID=1871053 RepID=UPI0027321530|nr:2-oxoglutarate and iron-dependent oxygenase domain-containing protein [Phenylobacterium sp.]MDP1874193.1 2-oxoglutarate and iron-dependent oxygenase domain-containing protein [Phenylobacterium sp.]MDP3490837.1 2-oxoglutarate and iron-dependent oxygenase domain-containing protein [Phenylobacterium sp.]
MAVDFDSIPVVDIAGLSSSDVAVRRAVAGRMGAAAREVGFLYVSGHGLDEQLFQNVLDAAKAFFAQPMHAKMASYIGQSENHSGYVPEGEEVFPGGTIDRKEAYDLNLDLPGASAEAPMLGANLWPDQPGFREATSAYYAAVSELAQRLFRGFALALDLPEDHFEPHRQRPPSQLRMIHYPYDPTAEDREGIGAHTDYEFFTILRGTAPGLEVRNGAGQWIDAAPRPGCYVINIGDMLEAWTNGVFTATSHRVRKVAEERYSFPFFATCDFDTVVEPDPRLVTAERQARYRRLVSGEHLFAQTARTFAYLKARRARGELVLPEDV